MANALDRADKDDENLLQQLSKSISDAGDTADEDAERFLTFKVHGTEYALEINSIKEIIEYASVTRVPMTPSCICGVINLRGQVVPVIDTAARMNKGKSEVSRRSCIIIIELKDDDGVHEIGFIVDSVNKVIGLTIENIDAAPSFGSDIRQEFIAGIGRFKEEFIVLLEMQSLFSIKELSELTAQHM